jgi:hypothetical protein
VGEDFAFAPATRRTADDDSDIDLNQSHARPFSRAV